MNPHLGNFFKITFRNLIRNKVYTSISVVGLALGISSCILIFLYVFDELSYDNYHEKGDRIYRLNIISHFQGDMVTALTNFGAGPTILQDYPEVENFVRFRTTGSQINLSVDNKVYNEANVWLTDSTIFDVFTYDVLEGDSKNALTSSGKIVLTQTLKTKYFGDESALGKEIKVNNTMVTVSAVIADPPKNSDMKISALLPMAALPQGAQDAFNQDWFRIGFYTFLLFHETPSQAQFEQKLIDFEKKYVQPWAAENDLVVSQEYHIAPLKEVHFAEGLDFDLPKGNKNYILIFSLLAVFILIIASINYINLSLAQSVKRAKEVGVRKTLGANQGELLIQFLGESLVITLIAIFIGLSFTELMLGSFNDVTSKSFSMLSIFEPQMLLSILIVICVIGLIAGSYPAFVLSRFSPVKVLKGILPRNSGGGMLQKSLILIQFIFSLFMITGTVLIHDQIDFLRNMNLGFDKENVMVISLPADTNVGKRVAPWVDELRMTSGIKSVAHTSVPAGTSSGELMFRIEQQELMKEQNIKCFFADEHFIDVLGLELTQGRNFDPDISTDQTQAFIINEQAAKVFGWNEDAIGKRMQWGLMADGQATNDGVVVGVVNNFNFLSLHKPLEPFVLCFNPDGNNMLTVRLESGDYINTISQMESEWTGIAPNHDFSFNFLDDLLDQNYQQEKTTQKIFTYFSIISILIASLGLFALVSFSIQARIKEIGIRKVLGASVLNLGWILVKDFFLLIVVAFVITAPVCNYLMGRWLEEFAYTVPFNAINYLLALLLAVALSAITISYHIFKISKSDPINALRYE